MPNAVYMDANDRRENSQIQDKRNKALSSI